MSTFKTKFVSVSDFKNFWGQDLRQLLGCSNDNESNYPDAFLSRVEDSLINYCDVNSFRNFKWGSLTPFQLECFQKAILNQAYYVIKSGLLNFQSGFDPNRGLIISPDVLNRIAICNESLNFLQRAGLFNLVVRNRPRFIYGSDLAESLSHDSIDGGPAYPTNNKK